MASGDICLSFDTNQRTNGNILFNGNIKEKNFCSYSVATELVIAIPVLAAMYTTNPIIKNIYNISNQAKFSVGTFLFFFVFSIVAFVVNASIFIMKKNSNAVMHDLAGRE